MSLKYIAILALIPMKAFSVPTPEVIRALHLWKEFSNDCKRVNKRFRGYLEVKPRKVDRTAFSCDVKSANWDGLQKKFGISRIAPNVMIVKDKKGKEDWQIAPGLIQVAEIENRPMPFMPEYPPKRPKERSWPYFRGTTTDMEFGATSVLSIGVQAATTVLAVYGFAEKIQTFAQKNSRVDETRKNEYVVAKTKGIDSPEYVHAKSERVAAENACLHCYNTKFEMYQGRGYHYAGFGEGISSDEHDPKVYDFTITHFGLGVNYGEK